MSGEKKLNGRVLEFKTVFCWTGWGF